MRTDARIEAFADDAVASSAPTVITAAAPAATPPIGPSETEMRLRPPERLGILTEVGPRNYATQVVTSTPEMS